jgi:hypothetical protein
MPRIAMAVCGIHTAITNSRRAGFVFQFESKDRIGRTTIGSYFLNATG